MKSFSFITALVFAYIFATVQVLAVSSETQEVKQAELPEAATPETAVPEEDLPEEAFPEDADPNQVFLPFQPGGVITPTMDMNEMFRNWMALCRAMQQQQRVPRTLVARDVPAEDLADAPQDVSNEDPNVVGDIIFPFGRGRYRESYHWDFGRRYGRERYGRHRGYYGRGRYHRGRYYGRYRGKYGRGRYYGGYHGKYRY